MGQLIEGITAPEIFFELARLSLLSGKLEQAISTYEEIILQFPNESSKAMGKLGEIYYRYTKDLEKAIEAYTYSSRGSLYNYGQIIKEIRKNIDESQFHYLQGLGLAERGNYDDAIISYKKSVELHPKNPNTYYELGNAYSVVGMYDHAMESYKKAIEIAPEYAEAYIRLADVLGRKNNLWTVIHLGQFTNARESQRKIIEKKKANRDEEFYALCVEIENLYVKAKDLKVKYAEAYYGLGNISAVQEKNEAAIEYYVSSVLLDSKYADLYSSMKLGFEVYSRLGEIFSKSGVRDKAMEYYKKAIQLKPHIAISYNKLGYLLNAQGNYEEAIEQYHQAIKLAPNYAYAHNGSGDAFLGLEQYNKAIKSFQKAIEIDPNYADPYKGLGDVAREQEKYENALRYYKKAIDLDPKFKAAYYGLGMALFEQREYEKSILSYKEFLNIDPEYAPVYNRIAAAYWEIGQYDKSRENLEKAIKINPGFIIARMNLAKLMLITEEFEQASDLSKVMLKETNLPIESRINILFISSSSLIFQKRYPEAFGSIRELIRSYNEIFEEQENAEGWEDTKILFFKVNN